MIVYTLSKAHVCLIDNVTNFDFNPPCNSPHDKRYSFNVIKKNDKKPKIKLYRRKK